LHDFRNRAISADDEKGVNLFPQLSREFNRVTGSSGLMNIEVTTGFFDESPNFVYGARRIATAGNRIDNGGETAAIHTQAIGP